MLTQKGCTSVLEENKPEGEPQETNANLTGPIAPYSTVKGPIFMLISVLTTPGQTQLMVIDRFSRANTLVYELSAALDLEYALLNVGQPFSAVFRSLKSLRNSFKISSTLCSESFSTLANASRILSPGIFCNKPSFGSVF